MANAKDMAAYILEKLGCVSAMKLQKLAYYSQAWSLVWEEHPLLVSALRHRLTAGAPDKDTIDHVLDFYGEKSAQWLSDLTHAEGPWGEARKGLASHQRGSAEISHAAMAEYYGSL